MLIGFVFLFLIPIGNCPVDPFHHHTVTGYLYDRIDAGAFYCFQDMLSCNVTRQLTRAAQRRYFEQRMNKLGLGTVVKRMMYKVNNKCAV